MPTERRFSNRADARTNAMAPSDTAGHYRDLCSNCDNGSECDGQTRPSRPIFFCEEFEVFGAVPAPEFDRAVPARPREAQSSNGHIGLCVNCDNARTCISPKPEGGVWHCEEYR